MEDIYWELPPEFKVYEALGALADNRIELVNKNEKLTLEDNPSKEKVVVENDENIIEARQFSSTKNKFYTIKYNPATSQIMTNDNATWFVGYLGYPALSLLLYIGSINFNKDILPYFKNIPFKEINQKNKNVFSKTQLEINKILEDKGLSTKLIETEVSSIFNQLANLALKPLGKKVRPPKGF